MSALVAVVGATAAGAAVAGAVAAVAARRSAAGSPLPSAHAHNDYRHSRPLRSALAHGFTSVEVDIWPGTNAAGEDVILVGHDEADLRGWRTLRMLYLEPLATRVAEYGAVYPDYDGGFQLLVEIKSDPERTWRLLDAELRRYAGMLASYEQDQVVPGPVSVVVTGKPPRQQLAAAPQRYAAIEASLNVLGSGTPVSLVPVCSANFGELFTWKGRGRMPDDQRRVLRSTVESVHAEGRRIRFWGFPAYSRGVRKAVWAELRAAGVDHLGSDDLRGLRRFEVKADRDGIRTATGPRPGKEARAGVKQSGPDVSADRS